MLKIYSFFPNLILHHVGKNIGPHPSKGQKDITKCDILIGFVCQTINWNIDVVKILTKDMTGCGFNVLLNLSYRQMIQVGFLLHPQIGMIYFSTKTLYTWQLKRSCRNILKKHFLQQ